MYIMINKFEQMDSLLFDLIPDELIYLFLNYLDCKEIFLCQTISPQFERIYNMSSVIELIRKKISYQTGLVNIGSYNLKKLKELSVFRCNRNIQAGSNHILITNRLGESYSLGCNNYGQLGLGDNISRKIPTLVPINNVIQTISNTTQSIWLTSDGLVYISGTYPYSCESQLNTPVILPNLTNIVQVSTSNEGSLLLNSDGQVYYFNNNFHSIPRQIMELKDIISVSTSYSHSLALRSDGKVYAWGSNEYGQLGLGSTSTFDDLISKFPNVNIKSLKYFYSTKCTNIPILIPNLENVVQIAVGAHYSLVLTSDRQVYSFGRNVKGQLGLPTLETNIPVPTCIPDINNIVQISTRQSHSLLLTEMGQVYGYGSNSYGQLGCHISEQMCPTLIPELDSIIQIYAGLNCSMALSNKGQIHVLRNIEINIDLNI